MSTNRIVVKLSVLAQRHVLYALLICWLTVLINGCSTMGTAQATTEKPAVSADSLLSLVQEAEKAYGAEQWSSASARYRELLVVLPADPYAWFRLGNSLTQQGLYSQAVLAYENSLSIDSAQTKPWFNLSTTHLLGAQVATLKVFESARISENSRADAQQRLDLLAVLLR